MYIDDPSSSATTTTAAMTIQSFFFPPLGGGETDGSGEGSGPAVSLEGSLELVSSDIVSPKHEWLNQQTFAVSASGYIYAGVFSQRTTGF
jgi:hypothetical protein